MLGAVAGVGVSPRGDVFVFRRANRLWPISDELIVARLAKYSSELPSPGLKCQATKGVTEDYLPGAMGVPAFGYGLVSKRV